MVETDYHSMLLIPRLPNMKEFFTTIPGIVISLGAILAVAVTGLLFVIGLFKKGKNDEDDHLIKILSETVTALETKVDNQKRDHDLVTNDLTVKIDVLTKKVEDLEKENGLLINVLQGKDKDTQEFYKKVYEAINIGNNTFELVKTMSENQTKLMDILVAHFKKV